MDVSNKNRKGSKVRGYAILGLFFISIVAAIMLGTNWYFPIPTPPSGPSDGGNPPIYYKTTVVVENPWVGTPHIKKVYSECLGTSGAESYYEYYNNSNNNKGLLLFPFEGTVEARLYYAGGCHLIGAWKIKVEKGDSRTISFIWYTTYRGTHIVVVRLYDKNGNIIDEKEEHVPVG